MAVRLPHLPQEIIDKILDFSLDRERVDYHSWLSTCLVSRHFKKTVEDYYVAHYLKHASLRYACATHYTEDGRVTLAGTIDYKKLAEGNNGRAILKLDGFGKDIRRPMKVCAHVSL